MEFNRNSGDERDETCERDEQVRVPKAARVQGVASLMEMSESIDEKC
jgi:hypothetical protein